jgi:hypothetical protein
MSVNESDTRSQALFGCDFAAADGEADHHDAQPALTQRFHVQRLEEVVGERRYSEASDTASMPPRVAPSREPRKRRELVSRRSHSDTPRV